MSSIKENGVVYAINRKESRKYVRKGEIFPQFSSTICMSTFSTNGDAAVSHSAQEKPMETPQTYRSVGEIVRHFCVNTSAHGWYRVGDSENKAGRTLWICLTLSALCCSALHMSILVVEYLQYSYEVQWKLVTSRIMFPSVTICNVLPFSMSTALSLLANNATEMHRYNSLVRTLDRFDELVAHLNKSSEWDRLKYRMQQPIGYYENIGSEAQIVGHQLHDMLLSCSFGDIQTCGVENFSLYQNPSYYNCYTLTGSNESGADMDLVASSTGPYHGLSFIAYMENDNGYNITNATYYTLSTSGNNMGLRVTIHQPGTMPSPVDRGYDIPPGTSASIGIKLRRYQRLGGPYGPCVEDTQNFRSMYGQKSPYVYTTHECQLICQQQYVMEKCWCIAATLPSPEDNPYNLTYCGYWDMSADENLTVINVLNNTTCEAEKLNEFAVSDQLRSECNCPPPCVEFQQTTALSYSYWPHEYTQISFYDQIVRKHPKAAELKANYLLGEKFNDSELAERNLIHKNFARVNVYVESMSVEDHVEKPSVQLSNLFSSAGGVFGLWIGMSVISWCEVVGLVVAICRSFYKRAKCKAEQQHITDIVVVQ